MTSSIDTEHSSQFIELRQQAQQAKLKGNFPEAAILFGKALEIDDRDARSHFEYGNLLMGLGDRLKALPHLQRGAHLIDHPYVKTIYADALSKVRFGNANESYKNDVKIALTSKWTRPADLVGVAISLLKHEFDFSITSAYSMVRTASGLVSDPLLLAILRNTPNTDFALEEWLIAARATLLEVATSDNNIQLKATLLPFTIALAIQMWISEFALEISIEEQIKIERIHELICSRLNIGEKADEFEVAILGCYFSLSESPMAHQMLWLDMSFDTNSLLTLHIRNQFREKLIAKNISSLTSITNEMSKQVRAQYEENPFPRWVSAPTNLGRLSFPDYIEARFPSFYQLQEGKFSPETDVLVAGCGTGQQPIGTIAALSNVNVLAIDISLASLSYAKRMAMDMSIDNIEFMQADILELGSLKKRFDLIECGGVLHHLANPEEGWRVLRDLLKPSGLMSIALYSRSARQDLEPSRELIRREGIAPTDSEIKGFRSFIKNLPDDDPCKQLILRRDFYTISMLRDLVFHVNEHEYNLDEIGEMTNRLGLSLLHIDVQSEIRVQFLKQNNDPLACSDLKAWGNFERENTNTFRGMYQMWFCLK